MALNYTVTIPTSSPSAKFAPSIWLQLTLVILSGTMVWKTQALRKHYLKCRSFDACVRRPSKALWSSSLFWQPHPVHMRIFGSDICVVQGNRNIAAMLKENSLSAIPLATHLMQKNRPRWHKTMCIRIREVNRRFLTGPEGAVFMDKFQIGLKALIQALQQRMSSEWSHWEDLTTFFKRDLTAVVLNAICGDNLLRLSPEFLDDLWDFNDSLTSFLTHDSKIFGTRKYEARDRALLAIERWQTVAAQSIAPGSLDFIRSDPHWGSSFFRGRYAMMQSLEGYDAAAMASQELSFLYALNSNAIIATFWTAVEVYKDVELLRDVRAVVESCLIPGQTMDFDVQALLRQPLLQAVCSHVPGVWCSTRAGPNPPVDVFWPGRFLRSNDGIVEFNLKTTEDSWVPFGGGIIPCPGRQFAKLQAIVAMALLVTKVDCTILGDDRMLQMSMKNFGIDILSPMIRRCETEIATIRNSPISSGWRDAVS
ncbi:hypothetical protein BU23DRAFT_661604 [Bimuria novae-zelandiae CBS 107.79]|uniref:Cytochrome P450 n=1 Tax=Bimuria novae-zelandiae CBS 107.79 TaxID=1447943 RepID=A0A6A5UQV3_9PLEO|nr:hypothetical protein BU23DRAFT_661604 [Bimuria novae-zelandiae CBS 107.79]